MALSPLDIHNKEFSSKIRGYDKDEVNDFLAQIVKDYSSLIKDNEGLKKELADAKEKVQYFTDMKEALNQSIIVAQESAEKVKNSAHQEADLIKQQAQQDGQAILSKAKADADQKLHQAQAQTEQTLHDAALKRQNISVQTEDLKRQSRVFRQRLQVMLESQLEVVKSPEWKELLSSSPEAADTTDPSQDSLDNAHEGFVNSEGAVSGADGTYTEIIFPDDQSGAPASQAAADTPASSAAAESESTNDSTNDSESATDHDAQ
jgi:cell division initiation protein